MTFATLILAARLLCVTAIDYNMLGETDCPCSCGCASCSRPDIVPPPVVRPAAAAPAKVYADWVWVTNSGRHELGTVGLDGYFVPAPVGAVACRPVPPDPAPLVSAQAVPTTYSAYRAYGAASSCSINSAGIRVCQ